MLCLGDDVYREPLQHVATGAVRVEVSVEPSGWLGYWSLFARFRPAVIVFVNGQLGLFPASAYLAGRLGGSGGSSGSSTCWPTRRRLPWAGGGSSGGCDRRAAGVPVTWPD